MKTSACARLTTLVVLGLIAAILAAPAANATEPRPWLCRDKPVFSWNHAMTYELSARPGSEWQMFFMQYQPDAANDGFAILRSVRLAPRSIAVKGKLPAGQYFAVALHRRPTGEWICPSYAHESPKITLGIVAKLCYGDRGSACDVNLLVKPDHSHAGPQPEASAN